MVASSRLAELRSEQLHIAERVTSEMLTVYGAFDFKAIDVSSPAFIEASVSIADRWHREASAVGGDMYLSMRRDAGVAGYYTVERPGFDALSLRRDLIVLGPVAAKKLLSGGTRIPSAARSVFTLTAGRVSTAALSGVRDTITGSTTADKSAVLYTRQVQDGACDFCHMLATNVYTSAFTALYSGGHRRRSKAPQPMGAKFHDHCRCAVVPIFETEVTPGVGGRRLFFEEVSEVSKQSKSFTDFVDAKASFASTE